MLMRQMLVGGILLVLRLVSEVHQNPILVMRASTAQTAKMCDSKGAYYWTHRSRLVLLIAMLCHFMRVTKVLGVTASWNLLMLINLMTLTTKITNQVKKRAMGPTRTRTRMMAVLI
jgi:hypothetical protein